MTQNILHIDSSPMGDRSVSRKLTAKTVAELTAKNPDSKVITRDLVTAPMPHLDGTTLGAMFTPAEQRDDASHAAVKLSEDAVEEVMAADVIVIGAPMWNFGIPSGLKAWIDHVVRARRTFRYDDKGQIVSMLPPNKKVIIVSTRGGVYSEGPMTFMDHQESYLKAVLGFIGLTDISFVRAEGVAMGEEAVKNAVATAEGQMTEAVKLVA
jgi:FMN-dependent NADH-azoreductase